VAAGLGGGELRDRAPAAVPAALAADMVKFRDATARTFGEMYRTQSAEFPAEVREPAIRRIGSRRRTRSIPELFARLYEDWSTLEGFQRTRGVLRLMAAVISALVDGW
jgi:predicted AAA+ superfamily ATPase